MTETKPKRPKIRDAYSPRVRLQTGEPGESRTHQSFKAECDMAKIVERYTRGDKVPEPRMDGVYADAPSIDLHQALTIAAELNTTFANEVPEDQRSEYNGNAFEWVADRIRMQNALQQANKENGEQRQAPAPDTGFVDTKPEEPSTPPPQETGE